MVWLSGWQYRKSHEIVGSTAGAQTNYQIRIKVHRTTGADSGEDVYVGTKCRADFGDIRFTKSDGVTLLDYWLEEYDGDVATFWVEVDNIPASPDTTTIYIYYGNPSATTTSNGDNTFLFFDHFEDLSKWTQVKDSSYITSGVSASEIYGQYNIPTYKYAQDDAYETSAFTLPASFGVKFKFKNTWSSGDIKPQFVIIEDRSTSGPHNRYYLSNDAKWMYWGSWYTIGDSAAEDGAYHKAEVLAVNDAWKIYEDDVLIGSWTAITASGLPLGIDFMSYTSSYSAAGETRIDWLFVRKYVDPEPSHGAWGSEESAPVLVETIVAKTFPMLYLSKPATAQELISKIEGATVKHVAKDYPEKLIKEGKTKELRSKFI